MSRRTLIRCLVVWLAVTALVGGGVLSVRGQVTTGGGPEWGGVTFEALLVRLTAVVGVAAGAWIWVVVTLTVVEAAAGRAQVARAGVVRRLVLAACGVALLGGTLAAPAGAAPGQGSGADRGQPSASSGTARLLGGLPLPERAEVRGNPRAGAPAPEQAPPRAQPGPATRSAPGTVVVRPGDTLWSIAVGTLPAGADQRAVDARWRAIHRANLDVVGADPDLIRPGQRLALPPP